MSVLDRATSTAEFELAGRALSLENCQRMFLRMSNYGDYSIYLTCIQAAFFPDT